MRNSRLLTSQLFHVIGCFTQVTNLSYEMEKLSLVVQYHLRLTVGFCWRILVDATVVASGDL